jgi:hypothetical protein
MTREDKADIPDMWRHVVHARRHSVVGMAPVRHDGENRDGHSGRSAPWGTALAAEHERILDHSHLDPALAGLVRSGDPSVAADAVRLALALSPAREKNPWTWYGEARGADHRPWSIGRC